MLSVLRSARARNTVGAIVQLLLFFAVMVSVSCSANSRLDANLQILPVLSNVEYLVWDSKLLGRSFHIHVSVPNDVSPGSKMPVVYLLDGDQTFPLMASYLYYMTFAEEMTPTIVVGISYGSTDESINKRITDFTAPSAENAKYGGADNFLRAFETELLSMVEARFPIDSEKRVLVGQSLGGQFAIHAALRRPGLFHLSLAVNPALHRNLSYYLDALDQVSGPLRTYVYISSGEFDDLRFREPALQWITKAQANPIVAVCMKAETLADESHLSSLPRAIRNALRWHTAHAGSCPGS